MILQLTEKQIDFLISKRYKEIKEDKSKHIDDLSTEKEEISEEGETTDATPKSGTSSQQGGGAGYPQVNKWESGVTRGPANQIGNTKWSDIVGASLKRGKANPLK